MIRTAGILIAPVAAVLVWVHLGLTSAAQSHTGQVISPGESGIHHLFASLSWIGALAWALSLAALLADRRLLVGGVAAVMLSIIWVPVGSTLLILLLIARLWQAALEVKIPATNDPDPLTFPAFAAIISVGFLLLKSEELASREYFSLSASEEPYAWLYPILMTAANAAILTLFIVGVFEFARKPLIRFAAFSGILGLYVVRVFLFSESREILLLDLGWTVYLLAVLLALGLPPLLQLSLGLLHRRWPERATPWSAIGLFAVAWAAPLISWPWLHLLAAVVYALVVYLCLFGILFDPWFEVLSTIKGLVLRLTALAAAALAVSQLPRLRLDARIRYGIGLAVFAAAFIPFALFHRHAELKGNLIQYSEMTKIELDLFKSAVGPVMNAGEMPEENRNHPAPGELSNGGERLLPRNLNYLFIMVDALRGDAFTCRKEVTPFLDRWAAEECVFFERAYSQGNGSFNSIPMLMGGGGHRRTLEPGMWGENVLYRLAIAEGIEHRFSTLGYGLRHLYPEKDPGFVSLGEPFRDGMGDWSVKAADSFARLRKRLPKGERFYAYIQLMDVHNDLWKKEEATDYGDGLTDLYANNINYLDRCMRELIGWLKAEGLYENTVIVLTSDHGEEFYEHASTLHGHEFFEEAIHVPLILRLPGLPAKRIRTGVSTSDIVPTLLDLTGMRYDGPMAGTSLRRLILQDDPSFGTRDLLLSACFKEKYGLYRDCRWKLSWWVTYESFALYDVRNDPRERRNVIEAHPRLASDMKRVMLEKLRAVRGLEYDPELPWE